MKKLFNKICVIYMLLTAITLLPLHARGQRPSDLPLIMTLKTNIYGYQGPANGFTIYLGSTENDCEFYIESPTVEEYIYVDPYTIGKDEEGGSTTIATAVHLSVTASDDEVRLYGDASKIDFIDAHGCYLSSFNLEKEFINLSVIDLSHNELTEIDLSEQTSLASIDLLDNAFTVARNMRIGTNHPGLSILSVGINEVIDPELDLRNFPMLQYFSARNNYGLTSVDPTGCPDLISLVLEVTNISSIDLSKNSKLLVLNLSNTKINSVDLSHNEYLVELYISHEGIYNSEPAYKLREIDLSNNNFLQFLDLSGNLISDIDVSWCPDLKLLFLQRNRLREIDLENNTELNNLDLSNNYFTFATLPLPRDGMQYFYYRSPLPCYFKYKVNEPIDFSDSVIRPPFDLDGEMISPMTYAAAFAVPRIGEPYELNESLYTYSDGVVTFHEAIPDSVFVEFFCDIFPEWPLQSSNFMIQTAEDYDRPTGVFTFTPTSAMGGKEITMKLGAIPLTEIENLPIDVTIYAGGEEFIFEAAVSQSALDESSEISFTLPEDPGVVTVAFPDGFALSALKLNDVTLASIDLSGAEFIGELNLSGCGLENIDLGFNRLLRKLDLSQNELKTLDIKGVRGDYKKLYLTDIDLSHNRLTDLATEEASVINILDLSDNNFSDFDFKYFTGLRSLDISKNNFSGHLDLSKAEELEEIYASANNLISIQLASLSKILKADFSENAMTLATIPLLKNATEYFYTPQKKLEILAAASSIDLSSQNIVIGNEGTEYVWKYVESNEEVSSDLLTIEGGITTFDASLEGESLYCDMTNKAYPAFYECPLSTTPVTVTDVPSIPVASFITAEDGIAEIGFRFHTSGDNAVYIDWKGDGTELEPYIYPANSTESIYRTGKTYAGARVKVYSYNSADAISVFALNKTKLLDLDLSPLTSLEAIDVHNAGLKDGSVTFPESELLWEVVFDGNDFTNETFEEVSNLSYLNLGGNNYSEIDLSLYSKLRIVELGDNKIEKINFGNNEDLMTLNLNNNLLEEINLEGLSNLDELILSDNRLKEIDVTPVAEYLRVLSVAGNSFNFATLPRITEFGAYFNTYYYANQKPMEVDCVDMTIDLSSQCFVDDTPTEYFWFLGDRQNDVYYDYEAQMFVGEELSDSDFEINDGVTTFLRPQNHKVICAMTNPQFPNLILYTVPTELKESGIDTVQDQISVDVYTMSGIRIKKGMPYDEAIRDLKPGMYIVGNKKIMVK